MRSILRLLRPQQWLKNAFVFTPLIFSKHLTESEFGVRAVMAFIAFCLVSSSVYIINDILDRNADKLHPVKKKRPIASGQISVPFAAIISLFLFAGSVSISLFLNQSFTGIVLSYFVLQSAYSAVLKHIVLVDVFVIAFGFMLRVFGGAMAIDVMISHWIVITTLFLSLFLAVSKRRSELSMIQNLNIESKRIVLEQYSIQFLDYVLIITSTGVIISYSLYTMAERTISVFGSENLIFTTVFVLFGIFRYLFLVINKGEGENPAAVIVKDKPMGINLIVWVCSVLMIIYYS